MNQAAASFKALISAFSQDASSHAVEVHAANLAAEVAAHGETRVAYVRNDDTYSNARLSGLIYFLDTYNVLLLRNFQGQHSYISAIIEPATYQQRQMNNYIGRVTERRLEAVAA